MPWSSNCSSSLPATVRSWGSSSLPSSDRNWRRRPATLRFDVLFLLLSFFVIAAALLLVALLFRLGFEQRASQSGLLLAVGWTHASRAATAGDGRTGSRDCWEVAWGSLSAWATRF